MLGKKLEQQHMGNAAVQNDGGVHAGFHRVDGGADLGDHAARNGAIRDQGARLG